MRKLLNERRMRGQNKYIALISIKA